MPVKPAISIVCPCFNHGRYVPEMLASVHAQSFPDYEVIIVNDGSTDGTKKILDNLHHEKLTVIHTQNHGPAAARNTAIAATKAPLIFNLDADDKIAPSLLEKAFAVFSTSPDLGIVHSEVQFFGARSGRFELPPYSLTAMLQDNIIHSTALFRKEDWKAVSGYSDELIYGLEDYDFWLSIIELGRGIYKIPEDLIFYRTYKNLGDCRSGKVKKCRRKIIRTQLTIFRRHEQLFKACPEEYERMLKLKKVWENEPFAVQWLKQIYYSLRYTIR
ncbi:MAG: glycosyltransferase family 2 protein [Verrucomicrobia bacterium]|nr:glycosyltransferase family 2 protein [Verrucomicrobiota bacterium]MBU1734227.1 glycosyltransferase family 2 protein [Verrucomicrobiota bacterium]MBU1855765.1 glycosyltransferase family 2 protein [Verrucomicrobiota bacterium]